MLLAIALVLPLHAALAADTGAAPSGLAIGSASDSSTKKSSEKSDSTKSDGKDSKNSGVSESEGKIFKTFKIGKWKVKPYVSPGGGAQINGSDLSGIVGVDAGFKYWRKKWAGDLYAGGSYTIGAGSSGYDVHLGDETGARLKYWGATLGLVGAYNGYVFNDGTSIKPALSASIPLKLIVGPKKYHFAVGIAPVFTGDKDRHVDWSKTDAIGFGDEFSWMVAAALKLKTFSAKVTFTQNVYGGGDGTAIVTNTPTISVGLGDIIQVSQ